MQSWTASGGVRPPHGLPAGSRRAMDVPVSRTPEAILVDKLRALDAAIAAGRASPDIDRREIRRDGGIVHAEMTYDATDPAIREILGWILRRHRFPVGHRKRQRATQIVFLAPSVFVAECLEPELHKIPGILQEFFIASLQRAVVDLFREPPATAVSARPGDARDDEA